jgi:PAS domain S-box-containing protein
VDSINCGLSVRNREGTILFVNERLRDWLGYQPGELEGKPAFALLPDEIHESVRVELRAVEQGDLRARITVLKRKDGTTFPVVLVPSKLMVPNKGERYAVVFVDLGAVQTAKQAGYRAGDDLGAAIDRIARELQLLGISASALPSRPVAPDHPDLHQLSPREREVLLHIGAGHRVPGIAKRLFISGHTVRNHLKAIYRKLGVDSQHELVEWLSRR